MATFLNSFGELAKIFGCKIKAEKVIKLATFAAVAKHCGHKAATIWGFLQDQEACKRYGKPGEILHSLQDLQEVTSFPQETITNCCLNMLRKGFIRVTADGNRVRAA